MNIEQLNAFVYGAQTVENFYSFRLVFLLRRLLELVLN